MKYSKEFTRDVRWFLKHRHKFCFNGTDTYVKKDVVVHKLIDGEWVEVNRMSLNSFKEAFPSLVSKNSIKTYHEDNYTTVPHVQPLIVYDKNGVDGIEAFYCIDSMGEVRPTRHPNILKTLLRTKGSVNLHIDMWAQSRAEGSLPKVLFVMDTYDAMNWGLSERNLVRWFNKQTIEVDCSLLPWMIEAVENQKFKYGDYAKDRLELKQPAYKQEGSAESRWGILDWLLPGKPQWFILSRLFRIRRR